MTKVELTEEDLKELENIIICLRSEDSETFKLGEALFQSKYPEELFIPMGDTNIPIENYWYEMDIRRINYNLKYHDFVCVLLRSMIKAKYYLVK